MKRKPIGMWLVYVWVWVVELFASFVRWSIAWLLLIVVLAPLWMVFGFIYSAAAINTAITQGDWRHLMVLGGGLVGLGGLIVGVLSFILAFGPMITSLLSMFFRMRGGGLFTRWALGARVMSQREKAKVMACFAHFHSINPSLKAPSAVYVLDAPDPRAFTIGSTMYLTRSLIRSPHLMGRLAHEMYNVNSYRGRAEQALRCFVMPPMYVLSRMALYIAPGNFTTVLRQVDAGRPTGLIAYVFAGMALLAGGGLGQLMTTPFWLYWFRQEIYRADEFAADLGLANPLIAYLEQWEFFDVAVGYFASPMPYIELRIDRLIRYRNQLAQKTMAKAQTTHTNGTAVIVE